MQDEKEQNFQEWTISKYDFDLEAEFDSQTPKVLSIEELPKKMEQTPGEQNLS